MSKEAEITKLFDGDADRARAFMMGNLMGWYGQHLSYMIRYALEHRQEGESSEETFLRAIKWKKTRSLLEMMKDLRDV